MNEIYWKKKVDVCLKTIDIYLKEIERLDLRKDCYDELMNKEIVKLRNYYEKMIEYRDG